MNAYILKIQQDKGIVPSFNTFYEYMRDVYRKEMEERYIKVAKTDFNMYRKEMEERYIKVAKTDFNIDNLLTTLRQYYKGGRYDFLLNSTENIDLLHKRFVVFEIDSVKDNAFYKQDAAAQRRQEAPDCGRGLEGPFLGEHG